MASKKEITRRLAQELKRTARLEKQLLWLYGQQNKMIAEKYTSLLSKYLKDGKFIKNFNTNQDMNLFLEELKKASELLAMESTQLTTNLLIAEYTRVAVQTYKDLGMRAPSFLYSKDYVRRMVEANFKDGKKFSERIWGNTTRMEEKLRSTLNEALASGEAIPTTVRKFSNITGQGYNEVRRVIRTETVATYNRSSLDTYIALGIEEVSVLGKQANICPLCLAHEGDIVKTSEATIGTNIPPFHPNDRCTIIPVIK